MKIQNDLNPFINYIRLYEKQRQIKNTLNHFRLKFWKIEKLQMFD